MPVRATERVNVYATRRAPAPTSGSGDATVHGYTERRDTARGGFGQKRLPTRAGASPMGSSKRRREAVPKGSGTSVPAVDHESQEPVAKGVCTKVISPLDSSRFLGASARRTPHGPSERAATNLSAHPTWSARPTKAFSAPPYTSGR